MNNFKSAALSIGRNCTTAQRAELRTNGDGTANYTLLWADGATLNQFCETKEQAISDLNRLGFYPDRQLKMAA